MVDIDMNEVNRKVNGSASFRFLNLTDEEAKELKSAIQSVELGIHYETKRNVGSIKLVDSSLVVKIDEFRRKHSIKAIDCDVFVSIYSDRNDETWRAPKAVNYIINIVNCPIVFSYTSK